MKHGTEKQRIKALRIYKQGCRHHCKICFLKELCDNGNFTPKEAAERFIGGLAEITLLENKVDPDRIL